MNFFANALKTSELWTAMLAAVLGVLVQFGVIQQTAVPIVTQTIVGLATYVAGRVAHKVVNGAVPFQPRPR